MTTILITGFGRFPGAPFNPSGPLALALAKRRRPALDGIRRAVHIFETSYAAVDRDLPKLIGRHKPDIVLMFGLAARTPSVRSRHTRAIPCRSCSRT
jgi:pyroglutamyl-peptidase